MIKKATASLIFLFFISSCGNNTAGKQDVVDASTIQTQGTGDQSLSTTANAPVDQPDKSALKADKNCNDSKRAYEFGREMYTWVLLRSAGLSLQGAIEEYSESLGIAPPFDSFDECVIKGFEDAEKGIKSPYNNDDKSWTAF